MTTNYFAEIILPLSLNGTFTYHLSKYDLQQIKVGQRVSVPFGTQKLYTGIVHSLHQNKPELYKTKGIHAFLDQEPLVTQKQIELWEWIASYYMCSLGDVYRNALPSALKLESLTYVRLVDPNFDAIEILTEPEILVVKALQNTTMLSVNEIALIIEDFSAIQVLKSLWEKGVVRVDEKLHEKYTPKIENYVRILPDLKKNELEFRKAIQQLDKAPKQRETLLRLIALETQTTKPIKVPELVKQGSSNAAINAMVEKNILQVYQLQSSRVDKEESDKESISLLTKAQQYALQELKSGFLTHSIALLHGVTSSGKTELYLQLMQDYLAEKKTVLYLLPEIGVTTQIVQRVKKHFGERVGVYHSKYNQNEKVELWQNTLHQKYDIIIGSRSAVFLPLKNLGLVIIDEEHESSYKQIDAKPYYNARDTALVLAKKFSAKVVLGSATPSLETYYYAQKGVYKYISLTERFGKVPLPSINLVDLRKAQKEKEITEDISHILRNAIQEELDRKKQVIIFQNRRGFAPVTECETCGYTPECPNCDVSLTYHKLFNQLKCHYCGHAQSKPVRCPSCGSNSLVTKGIGTEQIQLQLEKIFPAAIIKRMDVDAMRKKFAYEKLIEEFQNKEIDILVGTQMITKGLDFGDVTLVGVIRADSLLNFPDFRAHEKAFQLLTQVAGRAGRREEQGKVLIQAYNPDHQVLQNVTTYNYSQTMKDILYERKSFHYPPFTRLIQFRFKHKNQERVRKTAEQFVELLRPHFMPHLLLGPEEPSVARINNLYIMQVMLKINENQSPSKIKRFVQNQIEKLHTISVYRSVRLEIDVDPQ
ncbi:primosomal protein N' [Weeksella virosa]|uniref:Replication restart protein PriA n=1 Tax=Weeksella virosa (strain ATCC 43766 / DSM 16922 / JCM 21250 / CCUG 30538 / CDC 9751 / IAM 14551 / NBRC 16016 / NCTC 11634 / CL345/78) TaxID=865938 RepID=F0NYJ0_WEEVC|nr:primosomal protein N' [Weeksella virosa]ADX67110.1 primosomal protein N' [Weeksella virosa DSM 16922]VEH63153.1 Primosomal protein N' [Weeksella virosa]